LRTFAFFDLWCPPSEGDGDELPWFEGALRFNILDGNFSDDDLGLLDSLSSSASLSEEDDEEEEEEEEGDEDDDPAKILILW
jgi:hypothetical protein